MKKAFLEGLAAKYPGVSNSILSAYAAKLAEKHAEATAEEVTTLLEGVTFQQVLDFNGDQRATSATKTAEERVRKELTGDDKKDGDDKPDPKKKKDDDEEPAWAKKQREKIEALEARLAAADGDKIASTRKTNLTKQLKDKKAPDELIARHAKDLTRMSFKDEEDYQAWVEEVVADAEALAAKTAVKGATFQKPPTGGATQGDEKPSQEVLDRIEARKAETVAPAITGLPSK